MEMPSKPMRVTRLFKVQEFEVIGAQRESNCSY